MVVNFSTITENFTSKTIDIDFPYPAANIKTTVNQ